MWFPLKTSTKWNCVIFLLSSQAFLCEFFSFKQLTIKVQLGDSHDKMS